MAQASAKCAQASECFLDPRRRSLQASLAEPRRRPWVHPRRLCPPWRYLLPSRRRRPGFLGRISRAGLPHRCLALRTLRRPHDDARFSDRARLGQEGPRTPGPAHDRPAHRDPSLRMRPGGVDLARDSPRRCSPQGFRMPRAGVCFSRTRARGYTKVRDARLVRALGDALQQPEWGLRATSPRPKRRR